MTLKLTNISRVINRNPVLDNISFEVSNGETLVLLGPSGCGKSTTLRLIAGLDQPQEGTIHINNKDVTGISPVDRGIAMVFQSYALFPHLNVIENLSLGLKVRGVPKHEIESRVSNVINLMQINHLIKRKPKQLSGGQNQRIALARAFLRNPNIYLLDEPMSNLDAQLREELRPELRRLILEDSKPVIYVTHDQEEALSMATHIAVMKCGKIIQIDNPQNIYQKPNSLFVANFIGRPQINLITNKSKSIIGIRPEDIKFFEEGNICKLLYKEWLGKNQILNLQSEYGIIRMIVSSKQEIPETIRISWSKDQEHHFDSTTHLRIP